MKTITELLPATKDRLRLVAVTTTNRLYRLFEVMAVGDNTNKNFTFLLSTIQRDVGGKLSAPVTDVVTGCISRPGLLPLFAHAFQFTAATVEEWGMDTGNKTEDVLK